MTTPPLPGPPKTVWPCLAYRDAPGAIRFLTDIGFEQTCAYTDADDPSIVEHAELRWPEGGGVMLGTAQRPERLMEHHPAGVGSVYVVTDEPDAVYERCRRAGATVVQELREEEYGSRGFTITDPEGVIWSFGTYRGE